MIAARIFLPASRCSLIVDEGTDFPDKFRDELSTFGKEMIWLRKREQRTTRALNIYSGSIIGSVSDISTCRGSADEEAMASNRFSTFLLNYTYGRKTSSNRRHPLRIRPQIGFMSSLLPSAHTASLTTYKRPAKNSPDGTLSLFGSHWV